MNFCWLYIGFFARGSNLQCLAQAGGYGTVEKAYVNVPTVVKQYGKRGRAECHILQDNHCGHVEMVTAHDKQPIEFFLELFLQ